MLCGIVQNEKYNVMEERNGVKPHWFHKVNHHGLLWSLSHARLKKVATLVMFTISLIDSLSITIMTGGPVYRPKNRQNMPHWFLLRMRHNVAV